MTEIERDSAEDLAPIEGGLLRGKRGLVVGVANFRSIAWGIARHAHRHGAKSGLSAEYQLLRPGQFHLQCQRRADEFQRRHRERDGPPG